MRQHRRFRKLVTPELLEVDPRLLMVVIGGRRRYITLQAAPERARQLPARFLAPIYSDL